LAGLEVTYALDAATFAVSLLARRAMRTPPPPPDAPAPSWRSVVEGVRYAVSRQELLGTYLVDMNAMFFGMPLALFPALAEGYGGAEVLGVMYAAPAAGAAVVALTSGWTRHVHRHGPRCSSSRLPRFWGYDARSPADATPPPAHGPAPAPP
jgi:hypothetical protein